MQFALLAPYFLQNEMFCEHVQWTALGQARRQEIMTQTRRTFPTGIHLEITDTLRADPHPVFTAVSVEMLLNIS